jgi:large subunit ribosomal protein L30e
MADDKKLSPVEEIKKAMESDTLLIGEKSVRKALQEGNVGKILLASNCSDDVEAELSSHSDIAGVEVLQLDMANEELGVVCKKPFAITVLGLRKV